MHLEALDLNVLLVQLFLDAAHLARKICLDGVELLRQRLVVCLSLAEVNSRTFECLLILFQVALILGILGLEDFDLLLESGHLNAGLCMRLKLLLELFNPVVAVTLLSLEELFHVRDHLVRFGLFSFYRFKLVLKMKLLAQDHGSVLLAGA